MTDVSRENTVGAGLGPTGDYKLVGELDHFDAFDVDKFRSILKDIMYLKSDMNRVVPEFEEIGEELELSDDFEAPFDELFDHDEILYRVSRPAEYLVLCELLGEEPYENLQTCAVCGAHSLRQCPWD